MPGSIAVAPGCCVSSGVSLDSTKSFAESVPGCAAAPSHGTFGASFEGLSPYHIALLKPVAAPLKV